jgi:hypothetical protein
MNLKELIAGMLSLLVTAGTLSFAALAATTLDKYPGFLVSAGQLNAYVVVGSGGTDPAGLASDIAGAVDIAVRLAELQFSKTTVSAVTTTAVDGVERQIPVAGADFKELTDPTDGLPQVLQTFHYGGLKQGTISFKGTSYRYHEAVWLSNTPGYLRLDHSFADSKVNGTMTLKVVTTDPVEYRYYFDESLGSPSFTDPLTVTIAGKEFVIVGAGVSGLTALSGNIGTADTTTPVSYGGYGVYAVDGASNAWAKIQVKDSAGNVLVTDILNKGDVKTYTFGTSTFKVKLIDVFASTITNTVTAKVAVGPDVEKVYPTAKSVDSKYLFPGETDWYVYWNDADGSQNITANDYIGVFYHPTDVQYLKAGGKLVGPGGYFEIGFLGLTGFDKYVDVTGTLVSGKSIYATATSTSAEASGLYGFEFSASVPGSILVGSNGYDKVYVLFNGTHVWSGHWDSVGSKIVKDSGPTLYHGTDAADIDFTIRYAGVGNVPVYLRVELLDTTTQQDWLDVKVASDPAFTSGLVTWDYENTTASGTSPTFRLGATASNAEAGDVVVTYNSGPVNVGDKSQDVLTNTPVYVLSPSSNSASDKVAFRVPSDTVKSKVAFGKIGGTTAVGGVYYTFAGPVVSPVAKLDKELTAADKASKHLIVVGGPCVNSVAAEVLGLVYPACGTASGLTPDTAKIEVVDDKYASGLKVVLVYGWEARDTRLAANVLQNYDQATVASKLVGKSSVTVSGTSLATATIS